jgi:hypothetical protein
MPPLDPNHFFPRASLLAVLLATLSWLASPARAQEPPPKPVLAPPVLQTFVEAELPEGHSVVEGAVTLVLSIDAEGRVLEATVESGLEPAQDEAPRATA